MSLRALLPRGRSRSSSSSLRRALSTTLAGVQELRNASEEHLPPSELPPKAKVVICGGGAQGAAVAYKLAQRGLGPETVIIDKGELGGGTTWHSSSLVGLLKQSKVETKLCKVSKALYQELEQKGFYTGWRECGSLYVAQTKERLHHFRRLKSEAVGRGVECRLVEPPQITELCPLVRTDDLEGGLWVPGDCIANPLEICLALSLLAQQEGVKIVPKCEVYVARTVREYVPNSLIFYPGPRGGRAEGRRARRQD